MDMLAEARAGRHALLVAATGAGKTLAGFLPSLVELIEAPTDGLHTLYVSPLKAPAVDVQRHLLTPTAALGREIRVETCHSEERREGERGGKKVGIVGVSNL